MGVFNTGKFRFVPGDDLTEKDLGHILRMLLDQHIFDTDEIEKLQIGRAHV